MLKILELNEEELAMVGDAVFRMLSFQKIDINSPEWALWSKVVAAGYRTKTIDVEIPF